MLSVNFKIPAKTTRQVSDGLQQRKRTIQILAFQEVTDAFRGWALYLSASIAATISAFYVFNATSFVANSGLLILQRPFLIPLSITATVTLLYVITRATLAIARPREQGVLRVLFFAPVDSIGLLGAHLFSGVAIYTLLMVISVPLVYFQSLITNLPFPAVVLLSLIVSPLFATLAVSIGLFISSTASSSRSAILLIGTILLFALLIPTGYNALLNVPQSSRFYDATYVLRKLLRLARVLLDWVSPFSLLIGTMDDCVRHGWADFTQKLLAGLLGSFIWVGFAVIGLQRRGVLP